MPGAVDVVIEGRSGDDSPRPPKSSTAFRTISEVADDLAVAQHVLRFWESKFPQVRPLKRGGGRRYYRPEDVELLRQIRSLLYEEGYTIKGAQKLLRARRGRGTVSDRPEEKAAARPKREGVADPAVREVLSELRADLVDLRDLLDRLRAGADEDES